MKADPQPGSAAQLRSGRHGAADEMGPDRGHPAVKTPREIVTQPSTHGGETRRERERERGREGGREGEGEKKGGRETGRRGGREGGKGG